MNVVKNVLGRIFALWALSMFIISLIPVVLICWPMGLWPEPQRSKMFHPVIVAWMKFWFVATGIKRVFKGEENFKSGENYIVVCNHNSYMDVPLTSPGIPGPNKTIAKVEIAKVPVFGLMYKRGSVLVDRKSDESRKRSYSKMKEVLQSGLHMCIYPEGTRNQSAQPIQRFHDGAFRLAVDTKKPILPAVIFYTARVLPRHKSFYFWPHRVEMHFLPPVDPASMSVAELKEEVFHIMKDYYVAHNQ